MAELILIVLALAGVVALAMHRAAMWLWAAAGAVLLIVLQSGFASGSYTVPEPGFFGLLAWVPVIALALLSVPAIRRSLVIEPAYRMVKGVLPKVSETEQQALDAGTVGFDAELFSGQPDWNKLRSIPGIQLSEEERAFLDGPTEELCRMIDDWQVRFYEKEIPENIWNFAKKHGFLGM
ncbi:MAG: acyl-CoA dehydrogenase, partial [Hyphomicrobiaceae bacterium]